MNKPAKNHVIPCTNVRSKTLLKMAPFWERAIYAQDEGNLYTEGTLYLR